jgi:N-acetylneuraminic acid mutarotase
MELSRLAAPLILFAALGATGVACGGSSGDPTDGPASSRDGSSPRDGSSAPDGPSAPTEMGSWQATSTSSAPSKRIKPKAAWTGTRMLIWGGLGSASVTGGALGNGGEYDPSTDHWTANINAPGAPDARTSHTLVWTGTKLLVWGGTNNQGTVFNTGGAFDPAMNQWSGITTVGAPVARTEHSAVWTGTKMLVWGGKDSSVMNYNTGGAYDPATDQWTPMSTTEAPRGRTSHAAVWTGTKMLVWGGQVGSEADNTGGAYDPATDQWTPITTAGAPSARLGHTGVWTGTHMLVWGGTQYGGTPFDSGGAYDPATDQWTTIDFAGAPSPRFWHTAVWTGTHMLVWSGLGFDAASNSDRSVNTGAAYDPATDRWTPLTTAGAPQARDLHAAVWTGAKMVVWGGRVDEAVGTELDTGGVFTP